MGAYDFITHPYSPPGPKDTSSGPGGKLTNDEYNAGILAPLNQLQAWDTDFGSSSKNALSTGIAADGVTDDSLLLQTLTNHPYVAFPNRTFVINNNLTFNGYCDLRALPTIVVGPGVVLSFNGGVSNTRFWTFRGVGNTVPAQGAVVISPAAQDEIYPEMFGALPGGADCAEGLTRAAEQGIPISLAPVRYFINSRAILSNPIGVKMFGARSRRPGDATKGSQIVITYSDGDGLFVGTDSQPGAGPSAYIPQVYLSDFEVARSVGPYPLTTQKNTSAGIHVQYAIDTQINNVGSYDSAIPFKIEGSVHTKLHRCKGSRSAAVGGGAPGTDFFWGVYLRGDAAIPGYPGSNGLSRITECRFTMTGTNAADGATPIASRGVYADEACADLHVSDCETAGLQSPCEVAGLSTSITDALRKTGNTNITIKHNKFKGFTKTGILIRDTSEYAMVSVEGNNVEVGTTNVDAAATCFGFQNGRSNLGGTFTLCNNKALCTGTPTTRGIYAANISNLLSFGNQVVDSQRPVEVNTVRSLELRDVINNPGATATQGALLLNAITASRVAPMIAGASNAFPYGIDVTGSSDKNDFNCTGIDTACLNGGATKKLRVGGVAITVVGAISGGNNIASGVMV
jgi:hypothetical protein